MAKLYISPVFFVMLLISISLWYVTKLSYIYTTTIPFRVHVGDSTFDMDCTAQGRGYNLFAHKLIYSNDISVAVDEIEYTPSAKSKGSYVINPFSLQNVISKRKSDIRILSIGAVPEITITEPPEK